MEILQLQDVSYTYTGKTNVIEHVSLSFEQGKIYAIVGKSERCRENNAAFHDEFTDQTIIRQNLI